MQARLVSEASVRSAESEVQRLRSQSSDESGADGQADTDPARFTSSSSAAALQLEIKRLNAELDRYARALQPNLILATRAQSSLSTVYLQCS